MEVLFILYRIHLYGGRHRVRRFCSHTSAHGHPSADTNTSGVSHAVANGNAHNFSDPCAYIGAPDLYALSHLYSSRSSFPHIPPTQLTRLIRLRWSKYPHRPPFPTRG